VGCKNPTKQTKEFQQGCLSVSNIRKLSSYLTCFKVSGSTWVSSVKMAEHLLTKIILKEKPHLYWYRINEQSSLTIVLL
jgi:hypothetical protein